VKDTAKKILFIMQFPPPIHGVSVMNDIIRNSTLINSKFQCDYINLATAKNINDLQKNSFFKYILTLKIISKSFYKMLTNRYEYVYITIFPFGFSFIKDSIIVLLVRFLGQKPLLHLHTYGFRENSIYSKFKRKYYSFVFKNVNVICLSPLLIEDISHIYKGKVFILPNGIPQVNFKNTYNNEQNPITLLYLSNLIKGKGILLIIDAIDRLNKKGINFFFRIVGSEGDIKYSQLTELIKLKGLENKVIILGPKFGNDKYDEFKNAGIFLLPSNYDTFGLVLLEAMQYGVPCISSNIGGIPDLIGDGRGVLMENISVDDLELCINKLLTDKLLRQNISHKSFDYYISNFTVNIFESRLYNILSGNPDLIV